MTQLRLCDACSRHVFVSETHCPFCAVPLTPVRSAPAFQFKPGMSRAQRVAMAAAFAGLVGCGDDATRLQAPYGAPIPPADGGSAGSPVPVPFYGTAMPPDAGTVTPGTGGTSGSPHETDAGDDAAGDDAGTD
jgi:hypothetical protein